MSAERILQVGPVCIYEILGSGEEQRINALLDLYATLFPKYIHYVPRLRSRTQYPVNHRPGQFVHYWLVEIDGVPAGFRIFRYLESRKCGLAHALGILPIFRNVRIHEQRLSEFVVYQCLFQILRDARSVDIECLGMVNEVESERLMTHYEQMGIRRLPIVYFEPIFHPTGIEFESRILGFLPAPGIDLNALDAETLVNFASAFLVDHYGLSIEHPTVQQVIHSVRGQHIWSK